MKPKSTKVAPPKESKKPVPEGYVLVRLDRETGRGFKEILVPKDEFEQNPNFTKIHNAMIRKQKRDMRKHQDNTCDMPNDPADFSTETHEDKEKKAKMMRFIKNTIDRMKNKDMRLVAREILLKKLSDREFLSKHQSFTLSRFRVIKHRVIKLLREKAKSSEKWHASRSKKEPKK